MPTYTTVIPGLPGGPLTTSFPIKILTPPAWRTNVRPGIKARSPRRSIQHETGNPNTYAVGDATYLYNGSGGRQASWHFTVDDTVAYTGIPVDEITWQASDGAGPGNYNGISCELAVHTAIIRDPARKRLARRNAAELQGKVGARLNATPPSKQHHDYAPDGKNCPYWLRNEAGAWNAYVDDYMYFYNMEKAAMSGGTPTIPTTINVGDTIKSLVSLNVRQAPRLSSPVLKTVPVGTNMVVSGRYESADGYGWLPVTVGTLRGAVAMGDTSGPFIEKVKSATVPPKEPTYAARLPVPELLMTSLQKYDVAAGITTDDNGNDFVFVADVIEFTKPTVAARHAGKGAPPVKAPYAVGERAIAAWLVETQDNGWHYVLAGGDDEWVRVPYANTVRISDAPLLGDDTE